MFTDDLDASHYLCKVALSCIECAQMMTNHLLHNQATLVAVVVYLAEICIC